MNGKVVAQPRGRALGGSSAINVEAYIAQSKTGMDGWVELGNPGWDWDTMAPYYRKSHTLHLPAEPIFKHVGAGYVDEEVRGKSGPIQASFPENLSPLTKAWVDTFKALKYNVTGDPFSGQVMGGYTNPSTIDPKAKERSYSASAYYAPVKDRSNLHVLTEAFVEKILLETEDAKVHARGVKFSHDGAPKTANARKEVILAAGAIQSPQLLELSGIGGVDRLRSYNIPVYIDNPNVGENLQDHNLNDISLEVKDEVGTMDRILHDPKAMEAAMHEYQTHRTGPLSDPVSSSVAFMPLTEFLDPEGREKLKQMLDAHLHETKNADFPAERAHYKFNRAVLENATESSGMYLLAPLSYSGHSTPLGQHFLKPDGSPRGFVSIVLSHLYPFSRGSVHIDSADPTAKPTIDPRYFSHPLDAEIMARHMLYMERVAATEPFASLIKPGGVRYPPRLEDLDTAKEHVRLTSGTTFHPTGTCAMMPKELGGVVDERLLVHGTASLRVVDASIMPIITRGNPQSTVYAVAERAADLIKEDYGL